MRCRSSYVFLNLRESTVEYIKCDDVIHIPVAIAACSGCRSSLFAIIRTFLPDTGEPVKSGIYDGCTHCEMEVGLQELAKVRDWVYSNWRVEE